MAEDDNERLDRGDVIKVLSAFEGAEAFIIGGQALNLWAEVYFHRAPDELITFAPFTSKDIDYCGLKDAAYALQAILGGRVIIPDINDSTPNTAILLAPVNGKTVIIDFLQGVLGVKRQVLADGVMEIDVPVEDGEVKILVLHPILVLESRAANCLSPATHRRDNQALRQLRASIVVAREHILARLEVGDHDDAVWSVKELFRWLRSDFIGREVHRDAELCVDPLDVLRQVVDAPGWDERFRTMTLAAMIAELEARRAGRRG